MSKSEQEVLDIIHSGEMDAYDLLYDADPKLTKRFEKVDKAMSKLLEDVKLHFPDATYYTASGGFNLLLGNPHNRAGISQKELIACIGSTGIEDGDF